jgi:Flp pilus assembly protein TadB
VPIFHVVLVIASILLIVCAILVAISIYLRVLHLARRRRKSESTQNEDSVTNMARHLRKTRNSAPAALKAATCVSVTSTNAGSRQPLQIKIEEF